MANYQQVTSPQNPKIKLVKKLRDKRGREREGLFVVDDVRDLERAIACGYEVEFALFCDAYSDVDSVLLEKMSSQKIIAVPPLIYERIGYRQNPSSLVTVVQSKPQKSADDLQAITSQSILGLVDLRKPGNIGALLRTANASGFDAIFLIDTQLDIYNPNIIRSSTGACFLDNIYYPTTEQAIHFFQQNGYNTVAGHLNGEQSLFDISFDQKTAILLGTEDTGLADTWIQNCDQLVKIPMMGTLSDSLNVSVSGAVFMYEALRQRLQA